MKPLFCFLLLSSLLGVTHAQQDSLRAGTRSQGSRVLTNVVSFLPSALLVASIHETGHISIATVFGATNARWGIYRRTRTRVQVGWADYDTANMSPFGLASAEMGGVLFSRGFAEGAHYIVSSFQTPIWFQQFFSMTFLLARCDLPRYILQDAVLNFLNNKGSDIDAFVTIVCGRGTVVRTLAYSTLLAIATVDIVWDWRRIRRHWAVLTGDEYHEDDTSLQTQVSLRPYVAQKALGVSIAIVW